VPAVRPRLRSQAAAGVKVAVAGGSGFVGRHVVAALVQRGHRVVVMDRGTRPPLDGVERVRCDLVRDDVPAAVLDATDAVVNLVGIKRAEGAQTFEAAHVGVASKLAAAARAAGIVRFVHVSVVCARPDRESPYHDTKWRAEEALRASGLGVTVLRPGVIYGRGDDMLTHLTKMIGCAPVFPIVGRGHSLLQPVDVRDVAEAVAAAVERPDARGRTYDVVGPERLTLRTVVKTVAEGLGMPLAIVPTPRQVLRPAVRTMSALSARALSTPAQLRMVEEGLVGDPNAARRDLGLFPRRFTAEAVRLVEDRIPPLLGISLRLVPTRAHAGWLEAHHRGFLPALAVAAAGLATLPVLGLAIENVWMRMAAAGLLLAALSVWVVPLPWRTLFRPTARDVVSGVVAAGVLYAAGALVVSLLVHIPGLSAQVATVYAWKAAAPPGWMVPLLLLIVACEEVVWRNAVTLPLAGRLGPVRGILAAAAAFGAAHLSLGVPVLLVAALGAGAFWSALVVKTRSAVPALVSHILWDVAVLLAWPYGRG
jgi:uncharacterized protein YbjT (DUF2867 family)/membrane protease YdiL (CAAX protease family)